MENGRVVLRSRPGVNSVPREEHFAYESYPEPPLPSNGEVTLETKYIALDPALRCRMNEDTGVDYMGPWKIGKTLSGFGGIGTIINSTVDDLHVGDLVVGDVGWEWIRRFNADPKNLSLTKIDPSAFDGDVTVYLTALNISSGVTAHLGVQEMGHISPGTNQTMVVSGAMGAVGSVAGQVGKLLGCGKLVGICGSDAKCAKLNELGFDAGINYKAQNVPEALQKSCPSGIDVYFDNVGGDISDHVIAQMNKNSHVILCGQISVYNKDIPYPPPIPQLTLDILKERTITRDRYLVLNFMEKVPQSKEQLQKWIESGQLKTVSTVIEGLENAGKAFVSMMTGGNFGKQLLHVT